MVRADIDVEALAKQQQQSEEPGAGGAAGAEQQQQQAGSKQRRPRAHHPLSAAGGPLLQERAAQLPEAPGWMLPCSGWVQQFVSDFQQLRRQVADAYETGGECARAVALACWLAARGGAATAADAM